jgi:hypothetical protein
MRGLVGVEIVFGNGVEIADGLHGGERFEIGLNLRPLFRILFGDDGGGGVGVVGDDVVFELVGDDVGGVLGDHFEKFGVGLVGKRVAAGFDERACVEIAIYEVTIDVVVVDEDAAQYFDGVVEALDVEVFGLLGGTFDGQELECTELWKDVDKAGVHVAAEAGCLAVGLPVVVG